MQHEVVYCCHQHEMRRAPLPSLPIILCFLSSCTVSHVYLMSPLDINSNYYHSIPTQYDSSRSATYASLLFDAGSSNYHGRDNLYAAQTHIHRSNNIGHFQTYYGANLSIGTYHVAEYSYTPYYLFGPPDSPVQVTKSSQKSFGSYGFNGGIDLAIPLPRGGEWRVIGIETAFEKEFGSYLAYRKSLSDSNINILATYTWTKTIGLTTEFVWIRRSGTELGYKIALGGSILSPNTFQGDKNADVPFYFSHTIHLTRGKITGFCQANFGSHTDSFQCGVNYKLGKNK
jgi:hypothetical protein